MKRILFLLALALILSCSAEKGPEGTEGEGPPGRIVSVSIKPAEPNSSSSLMAEVKLEGGSRRGLRYRWTINDQATDEETGMLSAGLISKGDSVSVQASFPGRGWKGSDPVSVGNSPPIVSSVSLKPDPLIAGREITAEVEAKDLDGDELEITYNWTITRSESGVDDTLTSDEPTLSPDDFVRYDLVQVQVLVSDGDVEVGPVTSASLVVQNAPPEITSDPPEGELGEEFTYQVTAQDHEGDPLTYSLEGSPPRGMKINPATGLITWPTKETKPGKSSFTVVVKDGKGGKATQTMSFTIR